MGVDSIINLIRAARIDLSNEKAAQASIASVLEAKGISFEREVELSPADVIDFMVGSVGIEVKLRGAIKSAVYKQLVRYAAHDQVERLILASNLSMGLPPSINGKDSFFVSIAEGWL